jgi:chromosome segregation ATPase
MSTFKATLELDATGAITNLNDFEKQIKRGVMGSKELGETGAEAMEEIADETKAATRTLADIRKELKSVTNELAGVEDGSEAFTQLTQKAGALRNEIGDITAAINANAGPAVENLGNNFGNLQSSLTSLDFAGATRAAKGFSAQIGQVNFASLTKGIGEFGKSLASLGKALLANPIFLLAAAIGGIIAFSGELASLFEDRVNPETERFAKSTMDVADAAKRATNELDFQTRQLKALGKTEQEISDFRKQTLADELKAVRAAQQAQLKLLEETTGKFTEAAEKIRAEANQAIDDLNRREDELIKIISTTAIEQIERRKEAERKANEERLRDSERTAAKIKSDTEKAEADEVARQKRLAEIYLKAKQDRLNERNEIQLEIEEIENEFQESRLSDEDQALRRLQAYYFDLKTRAEESGIDITEIERIEEIKRQEIRDEFAEKRRLAEKEEKAKKKAEDLAELEQERALQEAKLALAQNYAGAATAVNDALVASGAVDAEKGFRISKALAAGQTTIATLQGIVNALSAPSTVPEPVGSALKAKNAIAIGITGAGNVAKILSQKFGGGSASISRPSIGGGGGAGSATQPATGIGGLQLTDIDNRPQQPRAYVIASDVTSQTEAAQKIADRARL